MCLLHFWPLSHYASFNHLFCVYNTIFAVCDVKVFNAEHLHSESHYFGERILKKESTSFSRFSISSFHKSHSFSVCSEIKAMRCSCRTLSLNAGNNETENKPQISVFQLPCCVLRKHLFPVLCCRAASHYCLKVGPHSVIILICKLGINSDPWKLRGGGSTMTRRSRKDITNIDPQSSLISTA